MFQPTRRALRFLALTTCLALTLPAGVRADDQQDRAEAERRAAEERQRDIDADQARQRREADEWQRQRAEEERRAAEERQREIDADMARQRQAADEWQRQRTEEERRAAEQRQRETEAEMARQRAAGGQ